VKIRGPWLDDASRNTINRESLDLALSAFPAMKPSIWFVGEEPARLCSVVPAGLGQLRVLVTRVNPIDDLNNAAERLGRPNIIVLLGSLDRFRRILLPLDYRNLLVWLRDNSDVTIFSAPRDPISPGFIEFGPYDVAEIMMTFPYVMEYTSSTTQRSLTPPRLIAGSQWLWASDSWQRMDEKPDWHQIRLTGRKTIELHTSVILKQDAVSTDYNQVSDVVREARFLSSVSQEQRDDLRLPKLLSFRPGRCINTLTRQKMPGEVVTNFPEPPADQVVSQLLQLAAHYARAGLFHNDIRPWNVLWDGNSIAFIDFAGVTDFEDDTEGLPQVLALAATLASLLFPSEAARIPFTEYAWSLWRSSEVAQRHGIAELMGRPWTQLGIAAPATHDRTCGANFTEAFLASLLTSHNSVNRS